MCGITGFIDFKKETSEEVLHQMTLALAHRGPDGSGVQILKDKNAVIGLGHRRLSIIDLSENGTQPMNYGSNWISYNGEIYNYKEIKKELESIGHTFNGDSDTEMILHAFEEWGVTCLEKFIGMFAFVIYNEASREIYCVRDRAGVKPFFYYLADDLFLFSSELKAFHEHPKFNKEIDIDSVASFLQYGNVPTPHCIFKNSKKIRPGHYFKISLDEKTTDVHEIEQIQYWNVYDGYNKPKLDLGYDEAIIKTESLLKSAFEYRMVSDVPVGVFLSGGYDSTCVTAILQNERSSKLKTFTIGVPDIGLNEAPYAKDVAQYLGTDHTEVNCTEKEAIELIKELPFYFDEPFADSSAIPTTLVSRMAKKDVTVALSADGGDEIFAGYNRYDFMVRYGKKLNKIPGFARKSVANIMRKVPSERLPYFKNKYNFHNRYEKLKNVLSDPSDAQIMLSLSQQFTDSQMSNIIVPKFEKQVTQYSSDELNEHHSSLAFMMAIDFQTYLVDDILQKVDRSTMSQGLEGREPFLDHRIIEFASQLPDDFKYSNGVKKRILKDIVHKYVPKEMMDRPKMGFAIPIADWLSKDLKDIVEEYLNEDLIKRQGILNWSYISKLKTDFFNGKKEYDVKIWYVLTFQMWYGKWMN